MAALAAAARARYKPAEQQRARVYLRARDDDGDDDGDDIRDMRARLIAQERRQAGGDEVKVDGWAYETPLIEQGSILLGGLEQDFGFALRQQYFHKCIILVTLHDPKEFTKGARSLTPAAPAAAARSVLSEARRRVQASFSTDLRAFVSTVGS